MRIAVVGAGAVGSYLATMLAGGGHDIAVLARGARAAAIRDIGISMQRKDGRVLEARPVVSDDPAVLGPQDAVFVTVKAYSVPELAPVLPALCGAAGRVVFVQNGLPWWYFADGSELLDPGGRLSSAVPLERVIGCVTYVNVRSVGPGRADHAGDDTFILGRPDGSDDRVVEGLVEAMGKKGIAARASDNLRREIWVKLWGSLAFNPLSALTLTTMDKIIAEPDTRPIVMAMMNEARALAASDGIDFGITVERRLELASSAGAFKTSMLQDLEAGRPLETDAIIGAVAEHARNRGVPTPMVDTVLGLLRQKARALGLA
jgi:2-dehydropantoate 2-reductase